MIRLITPPLPAVSRPSNRTTTRRLRFLIHSSSCTSSTCRRLSSLSYSLRVSARFCFFLAGMRLTLAWSDHLRRLCLRVADVARPQDLVDDDRAQGPDSQVVDFERADLEVGSTGGKDERDRGDREVGPLGEVDPGIDPDLGADHCDQAEQVKLDPPQAADREAEDQRSELRNEPEQDRGDGGHDEHPDRKDSRDAHDADVLRVGRLAGAAEQGADGGGETVAHEGAAEVARQVALHDAADREDMAGVLGHQHDRDEPEEAERADGVAEVWECELRVADPVGAADYRCVDVAARRG